MVVGMYENWNNIIKTIFMCITISSQSCLVFMVSSAGELTEHEIGNFTLT